MSETTTSGVLRRGVWLLLPALLVLSYFATYFATVLPADTLVRVRSGSTVKVNSGRAEPDFSLRYMAGVPLPIGFWRTFFAPAWRVDRVLRPEVWHSNSCSW